MSKLITRTAFIAKLQRRGYKHVSTASDLIEGELGKVEVYRRPRGTREYWVAEQFVHRFIVDETSMKWDGYIVIFQPEKGGEV